MNLKVLYSLVSSGCMNKRVVLLNEPTSNFSINFSTLHIMHMYNIYRYFILQRLLVIHLSVQKTILLSMYLSFCSESYFLLMKRSFLAREVSGHIGNVTKPILKYFSDSRISINWRNSKESKFLTFDGRSILFNYFQYYKISFQYSISSVSSRHLASFSPGSQLP